ncbi:VOC family protein [Pseudoroseicyclus sp. H15]
MGYYLTIDVPDIEAAIRFYCEGLGFELRSRLLADYVVLSLAGRTMGLLERPEGSIPVEGLEDRRRYSRHWTPVHLDIDVGDIDAAVARAVAAGAILEKNQPIGGGRWMVTLADPFGHAFCMVGQKASR